MLPKGPLPPSTILSYDLVLLRRAQTGEVRVPVNLSIKKLEIDRTKSPIDHLSAKQAAFVLGFILLVLIAGFILFNSLLGTVDLQDAGQLVGP